MVCEEKRAIEALIPHRDPFLFVDRIVDRTEDTITTEWRPSADMDVFRGHYPGAPLLPGVLISEFVFQSSALLLASVASTAEVVPVLTKIENARFRRMVQPEELLTAIVEQKHAIGKARYMQAKVTCEGEAVLRIEFVVAELAPPGDE